MPKDVLVLAYGGCGTCKKALAWLKSHGVAHHVRPIVEEPPSSAELAKWVPASGKSVRKWLNASGQSYRALGKEAVDAASDADLAAWLTKDGKLVKRPVLVASGKAAGKTVVLVGFKEDEYAETFG